MKAATQLVQRARTAPNAEPLTTPIYETTTFVFDSAAQVREYNEGRSDKYLYTRYGNPTLTAVEEKLAKLEGGESAMILSSGQAATTTALLGLLKSDDEVVCSAAIYGGTLHLLADLLSRFNIRSRFVSTEQLRKPEDVLSAETRLLWFESPINPTLRCIDVRRVSRARRDLGDRQHVREPGEPATAVARR
jgi:methionine-gamma-lyase